MTTDTIQEGDKVILKKEKIIKAFSVHVKRPIWIEKTKFTLEGIIGHPYGSLFEVRNGALVKVKRNETELGQEQSTTKDCSTAKDNRHLQDTDANQKLCKADIVEMRDKGLAGEEIIGHLIENSTTFKEKTEYSQAKYIKKKKNKHLLLITVLRPNTRLIAEMYFNKAPAKINYLRIDTLSQILSYGNVFAHSKVMVVDTIQGMVLAAVLERTGGFSKVIQIHHANFPEPSRSIVSMFAFPSKIMDSLLNLPMNQLNQLNTSAISTDDQNAADTKDIKIEESSSDHCDPECTVQAVGENSVNSDNPCDNSHSGDLSKTFPEEMSADDGSIEECGEDSDNKSSSKASFKRKRGPQERDKEAKREKQQQKVDEARKLLLERNMDSLIIACKYHPTPIVSRLLEYMAPSRPVVIFSQYKEPLMDTFVHLKEQGNALNFRLTETWLREYQILPSRTHPDMQMSGGSGYLLTFTTCTSDNS